MTGSRRRARLDPVPRQGEGPTLGTSVHARALRSHGKAMARLWRRRNGRSSARRCQGMALGMAGLGLGAHA